MLKLILPLVAVLLIGGAFLSANFNAGIPSVSSPHNSAAASSAVSSTINREPGDIDSITASFTQEANLEAVQLTASSSDESEYVASSSTGV